MLITNLFRRVVELLTKQWFLSTKVRLPAVSRLQVSYFALKKGITSVP